MKKIISLVISIIVFQGAIASEPFRATAEEIGQLPEFCRHKNALFRTDADGASGSEWTTKYIGKGIATPDLNNVIVLRLSEMYLNRAEASVNGATVSGATALGVCWR